MAFVSDALFATSVARCQAESYFSTRVRQKNLGPSDKTLLRHIW
jgi:hypothetical protein